MSVISLTPEQLRDQAKVYTRASEGVAQQRENVNNMNSQIAQQWKGEAFNAYLEQYAQLEVQVKKFENLLIDINNQLNEYATVVADRDAADAKAFGLR